jgi:hypothetical protein
MEAYDIRDDPVQLVNTLKAFAELRSNNAISDAEYEKLKAQVLTAIEQRIMPKPAVAAQTTTSPVRSYEIQDCAADLHSLITEKLAREYPGTAQTLPDERKRYLMAIAAQLMEKGALNASDMAPITKVIDIALDQTYADSLERLTEALLRLSAIRNEIRLRADSSPLAKTITGVASQSAEKAVEKAVETRVSAENTTTSATPGQAAEAAQTRRGNAWATLKEDVTGAFVGASTASTILAGPGFPLASLAFLSPLGPVAMVVPVLGAVMGAGMMSGLELARRKTNS